MRGASQQDKTLKLWDVRSGELRTLEGHTETVTGVAFGPLDGVLASSSLDRTVKLWDVHSGKLLRTLEGHTSSVINVAFSSEGHLLASLVASVIDFDG